MIVPYGTANPRPLTITGVVVQSDAPVLLFILYNKDMRNYLVVPKTLSKYRNIQTEYNGIKYMSKKEAEYAMQLDWQRKAKDPKEKVTHVEVQVPFQIILNGIKICKYLADFKVQYADGREEIIDVKGVRTDVYRLKKKLVEAQYGIEIIEV